MIDMLKPYIKTIIDNRAQEIVADRLQFAKKHKPNDISTSYHKYLETGATNLPINKVLLNAKRKNDNYKKRFSK